MQSKQTPDFSSLFHSFRLERQTKKYQFIFWARLYFYRSASPLTSDLLLTASSTSTNSRLPLCALLLLKSVFPILPALRRFSLPLVAVETCTSPSSSIQNGSIPLSPDSFSRSVSLANSNIPSAPGRDVYLQYSTVNYAAELPTGRGSRYYVFGVQIISPQWNSVN